MSPAAKNWMTAHVMNMARRKKLKACVLLFMAQKYERFV